MSGGVFLEVLSICYNRTGAFLVIGIYLILLNTTVGL